jgi:hypothetical protein
MNRLRLCRQSFDLASNPDFKPEKPFKARVVLLSRDHRAVRIRAAGVR